MEGEYTPKIPMKVVGGNSSLEEAEVVLVGTENHYNPAYQRQIARTLGILAEPDDIVLTEGEPFGNRLSGSWVPEMAGVNTSEVTLMGWENPSLYNKATGIVRDLSQDIQTYNALASMSLGQLVRPLIDGLKRRIEVGRTNIDRVVLHERTAAMKHSIMNVVSNVLQKGGTTYVYAGAAHLTNSELGGMGGLKYAVLEV
jgi:hypothetical protein